MTDMELQEMRQQMDLLKEKLNRHTVINEQMMRRSMESRLSRISLNRKIKRAYIILCIIVLPPLIVKVIGLPIWFALATVALLAISLVYHEAFMEQISADDLNRFSLKEINERTIRLKEQSARWLWISIPMLIAWLLTFVYVVQHRSGSPEEMEGILYGIASGIIIGSALGFIIYRKQQRMINDLRMDISADD